MEGKEKGYRWTDVSAHILVPLALYLLIGLAGIELWEFGVSRIYYIFWGVMAVIVVGIREYIRHRSVTIGIAIYVMVIISWFYRYKEGQYQEHIVLAAAGLCAIFLLWKLLKLKIVRVFVGYVVLLALIGFEFADIHFSKGILALAIFLFLYSVSETLSNRNSFIIIYLAATLTVTVIPAPKEPYDWHFVVSAAKVVGKVAETFSVEIEYLINRWGWDGVFHYGFSGYSDSSMSLSAGMGDRDIEQMTFWGIKTTRNLYLKGNVCDSYTGNSWETKIAEETLDYKTDTLMMLYAIFDYTQEKQQIKQFVKVHKHDLTIQNIKTQSIFCPLKTFAVSARNIRTEGDNLRSSKVFPRGPAYTYSFIDIDYASTEMNDILQHSANIIYDEDVYDAMFENMWLYYSIKLEKPSYQDFLREVAVGEKAIKEQYLDTGNAVSDKVKSLSDSITKDCRNDYEKCRALEKYLYQYNYNKSIHIPEGTNVLDWFLFEGKEGYCVHFATALAAMLRCEGIPSRVAEGFLVDYSNQVEANRYSISSSSAHAWVEAYLDGVGWIRLEPTPVFAGNAYEIWYSKKEPDEEEEEEEEEEIREAAESEDLTEEEELLTEETGQSKEQKSPGLLPVILFGGMVIVAGGIFIIVRVYQKIRLRKSNNPDVIFAHLLSILGKKYILRTDEETVREYFIRILETGQLETEAREDLETAADLMEAYWYGSHVMDGQEMARIKEIREAFIGRLVFAKGKEAPNKK